MNQQNKTWAFGKFITYIREEENWAMDEKGWLKFEKNPDIAKINGIEPVELPKMTAQVS